MRTVELQSAKTNFRREIVIKIFVALLGLILFTIISWYSLTFIFPIIQTWFEGIPDFLAEDKRFYVYAGVAYSYIVSMLLLAVCPVAGIPLFFGYLVSLIYRLIVSSHTKTRLRQWARVNDAEVDRFSEENGRISAANKVAKGKFNLMGVKTSDVSDLVLPLFNATIHKQSAMWYFIPNKRAVLLRIEVGKELPSVVINYLMEHESYTVLPNRYKKATKLQLPGDMSDYFSAWSYSGHENAALQLLSPDTLQAVLFDMDGCDIELNDSHIDVVWPMLFNDRVFLLREAKIEEFIEQLLEQRSKVRRKSPYGGHIKSSRTYIERIERVPMLFVPWAFRVFAGFFLFALLIVMLALIYPWDLNTGFGGVLNTATQSFSWIFYGIIAFPLLFFVIRLVLMLLLWVLLMPFRGHEYLTYLWRKDKYLFYYEDRTI